jgi:MOSC domain-containing protein YiiM
LSDSQIKVAGLYWCPVAGDPMRQANALEVQAERGVVGDRYALGVGAYSDSEPAKPRHLTLITQDGIDAAADWQRAAGLAVFDAPLTRRNVVVSGMSASALNELVGRRFRLGDILCEAVELATPCDRPSALASIDGFQSAFDGRGGLRVRVLDDGVIRTGDHLTLPDSA